MSAALQFVNSYVTDYKLPARDLIDEFPRSLAEASRSAESVSEFSSEQGLRRALAQVAELQAELRRARNELINAERQAQHYETLLRNAKIREHELKALVGREAPAAC